MEEGSNVHISLRYRIIAIPHDTSHELEKKSVLSGQTQPECLTDAHSREWETPLMIQNPFLWWIDCGWWAKPKLNIVSTLPPAGNFVLCTNWLVGARQRKWISSDVGVYKNHVLVFTFMYEYKWIFNWNGFKISFQDRLLSIEWLRLRYKEKESY